MAFRVLLKPSAEKDLKKLPVKDKERILAASIQLSHNPYLGKKLEGEYKGFFSLRVWPYRIIYTLYKKELLIVIVRIGHRQGVYK